MVTVIIPCFNVDKYIARCLQSVSNQTYSDLQIICVDNGSTDRTCDIIRNYMSHDSRVELFIEPRRGAPAARNCGLTHAKGTWIQFLDADDSLHQNKLTEQIKSTNKLTDFVVGAYFYHNKNGIKKMVFPEPNSVLLGLMKSSLGSTCSNLYRKSSLLSINGWAVGLKSSQEYELMLRLVKNGFDCFVAHEGLLTNVYYTEGSISTNPKTLYSNLLRRVELRFNILNLIDGNLEENLTRKLKTIFIFYLLELESYSLDKALYYLRKSDLSRRDIIRVEHMSLKLFISIKIVGIRNFLILRNAFNNKGLSCR